MAEGALLAPLLDALEALHEGQIYHRDISPDNLLISGSGVPLLLDFGAARQIIADMTQAPTAILKPLRADRTVRRQREPETGAWTDIYALSAMLYFALIKSRPPLR